MWVPRARLFEALSIVNHYANDNELARLIWPDGRRLPVGAKPHENEQRDLIPFDGSLDRDSGFCLSLPFEADEVLREYDEAQQEKSRQQQTEVYAVPQRNGKYSVGCIYIYIHLEVSEWEWLEGETELVRMDFGAVTSSMSDLFTESLSIQSWFVALAREIGAFSCVLDYEGPFVLLFLEGEELHMPGEERSHVIGPFELRHLARHPESESAFKARLCNRLDSTSSANERLDVRLYLNDNNSGVRAKALKAVAEAEKEAAHEIIEAATRDPDWRVRAVAAYLLGYHKIPTGAPLLEQLLSDTHPEVRITAALSLNQFPASSQFLLAILASTPPIPPNLGLIKAALISRNRILSTPL